MKDTVFRDISKKKNPYYVSRSFGRHGFKNVCFFEFVLLVSIHDIGEFDFWLLFWSPDSSFGPTHVVVVNAILTDKNVWSTERPSSSRVYYFVRFAKRLESVCPVFVKTSDVLRDERQGFSVARTRKTSPVSRSVHHPPSPQGPCHWPNANGRIMTSKGSAPRPFLKRFFWFGRHVRFMNRRAVRCLASSGFNVIIVNVFLFLLHNKIPYRSRL